MESCQVCELNPLVINGLSDHFQLFQATFNLMGVRSDFQFYFVF